MFGHDGLGFTRDKYFGELVGLGYALGYVSNRGGGSSEDQVESLSFSSTRPDVAHVDPVGDPSLERLLLKSWAVFKQVIFDVAAESNGVSVASGMVAVYVSVTTIYMPVR